MTSTPTRGCVRRSPSSPARSCATRLLGESLRTTAVVGSDAVKCELSSIWFKSSANRIRRSVKWVELLIFNWILVLRQALCCNRMNVSLGQSMILSQVIETLYRKWPWCDCRWVIDSTGTTNLKAFPCLLESMFLSNPVSFIHLTLSTETNDYSYKLS